MLTTPSRKITRPLRNNVSTATLTLAALALAASCTITGCKENKPPAPEAANIPQQPVPAPAPILKKHLYSDTADPKSSASPSR